MDLILTARIDQMIDEVTEFWMQSRGKTIYLKFLRGEKISLKGSMAAKCADCMGGYADGREDCECPLCPLYPFMLYRKDKPKKKVLSNAERIEFRKRFKGKKE